MESTVLRMFSRVCLNKENRSKDEADHIVDKKLQLGEVWFYYKCPFCSSHHLTSSAPIQGYAANINIA